MAAAPSEPSACRGSATSVGRSPLTRVARSLRCAREPVGLSLEGAAALIGVSASLFTRAVQEGDPEQSITANSGPPKVYEQVGTGSILTADGYIVTNKHVVRNAYHVEVTLYDGAHVNAKIVGVARNFDLAVLKVEKPGLTPATIGDSDQLKVGETVIAMGTPLGLQQTVSVGVVSALHRVMGFSDFDDLIQTDAAINPGNSGGPLFNIKGEVVGINQAIYTVGSEKGSIGLGIAIPTNEARNVIRLLVSNTTDRGLLGVSIQTLTPDLATASSSDSVAGVIVTDVLPNSAASKAGLQQGDIITKLGGEVINDTSKLHGWLPSLRRPQRCCHMSETVKRLKCQFSFRRLRSRQSYVTIACPRNQLNERCGP